MKIKFILTILILTIFFLFYNLYKSSQLIDTYRNQNENLKGYVFDLWDRVSKLENKISELNKNIKNLKVNN